MVAGSGRCPRESKMPVNFNGHLRGSEGTFGMLFLLNLKNKRLGL